MPRKRRLFFELIKCLGTFRVPTNALSNVLARPSRYFSTSKIDVIWLGIFTSVWGAFNADISPVTSNLPVAESYTWDEI